MKYQKNGFTFIELLVVIAIITLLSVLAVVALASARAKARDAKRLSDIKQVQAGIELFFADHGGQYPSGDESLGNPATAIALCDVGFTGTSDAAQCSNANTIFIPTNVPRDPLAPLATPAPCGPTQTTAGCDYHYIGAVDGRSYALEFVLEGQANDLPAGLNCAKVDGFTSGACAK